MTSIRMTAWGHKATLCEAIENVGYRVEAGHQRSAFAGRVKRQPSDFCFEGKADVLGASRFRLLLAEERSFTTMPREPLRDRVRHQAAVHNR